jgi:predicted RNase H-like nuclease (RuvC/YqgF family)
VVEKGLVIQEKDKMYTELKAILARQPGPEVAEQVAVYQGNLKTKTRQMKAMASELNMCQAQVNEYRYEMERLNRELQEVKRKYFVQKRKDTLLKELGEDGVANLSGTAKQLQQQQQATARTQTKKFAGGGYAIK